MSRILSIQQTKPEFVKDLFSRMMVAPKVVLSGVPYGYYPLLKETFPEAKCIVFIFFVLLLYFFFKFVSPSRTIRVYKIYFLEA